MSLWVRALDPGVSAGTSPLPKPKPAFLLGSGCAGTLVGWLSARVCSHARPLADSYEASSKPRCSFPSSVVGGWSRSGNANLRKIPFKKDATEFNRRLMVSLNATFFHHHPWSDPAPEMLFNDDNLTCSTLNTSQPNEESH